MHSKRTKKQNRTLASHLPLVVLLEPGPKESRMRRCIDLQCKSWMLLQRPAKSCSRSSREQVSVGLEPGSLVQQRPAKSCNIYDPWLCGRRLDRLAIQNLIANRVNIWSSPGYGRKDEC